MKVSLPLAFTLLATASACSNIERTRDLANPNVPAKTIALQVCSNCHGVDGNAVSPNFPNLAGQTPEYLTFQLKQFRDRSRSDQAGVQYMWGLTRSLSDAQIEGLAAYFAAQTPVGPRKTASQSTDEGKDIYLNGIPSQNVPACVECHGNQGQGVSLYPRLASQHADYLAKQLMVYRHTDQRPAGVVMKPIAQALTDQDMRAIVTYLQTMPADAAKTIARTATGNANIQEASSEGQTIVR
jgi:cytochrome c553